MAEETRIYPEKVNAEGVSVSLDFVIKSNDDKIICMGYFDRAKVKVKSIACSLGRKTIRIGYNNYKSADEEYKTVYKPVSMGRDRFVYGFSFNKGIGSKYLLTTMEFLYVDFYEFLMKSFKLPLLEEWTPYIYKTFSNVNTVLKMNMPRNYKSATERRLPIHGKPTKLKDIVVLDVELVTNEALTEVVSRGLKNRAIFISKKEQKPLEFQSFDEYITNYGKSMVKNLECTIEPLVPLKGTTDSIALKTKRLFPQQAACVNGLIALKNAKRKYGFAIEGMGCGKTVQGATVVDGYFNQRWLEENPDKSLKDLYHDDTVGYRNIVMAPSHLVEKWKAEILKEIPNAKAYILDDFSKLLDIREAGKERNGREWYLISKDTAKLGSLYSPIPTSVGHKYPKLVYCKDCFESRNKIVPKRGRGNASYCPDCNSRNMVSCDERAYGRLHGMLCPECGELLLNPASKYGVSYVEEPNKMALHPHDFSSRNTSNSVCYHCGAQLWGVDCKPVDNGLGEYKRPRQMWYKISHWKNHTKKSKKTAFVLRGKEAGYLAANHLAKGDYTVMEREYGPRKFAPALFIKKYLKGYFDFCLLDEAHKYEGAGTAQANAAHALMKVSDFTLCLTGTITNGKADSFFYLFYMLDPRRMKKMGFQYTDVVEFSRRYGTVETVYESGDTSYNAASRGRILQSPKVKPGISPVLFMDFLLDCSVFLDLSDLAKHLPKLTESVELLPLPKEIQESYRFTTDSLKESLLSREGAGLLSAVLQFDLSYPDKPYGRKPIVSPYVKDCIVAAVPNHDEYSDSSTLMPKEERLVEIINEEISQNRNCFVYCSYTGDGETNVTYRLQEIIEKNCNLRGQVQILQASSPAPQKREEWIKKKAGEGIRVFICNPKCVETGLDFCFEYKGRKYNYPTIIFYQVSYELSVMWQASRRAYRLNQTLDCKTIYMGYENTLQAAAIEIMAEKQAAASAIQGKFSVDGLTAMAKGIDPRVKLAQKLSSNDNSSKDTLLGMFATMNKANQDVSEEEAYTNAKTALTYYELMGISEEETLHGSIDFDLFSVGFDFDEKEVVTEDSTIIIEESGVTDCEHIADSFFDSMFDMFGFSSKDTNTSVTEEEQSGPSSTKPKSRKKRADVVMPMSLLDILSA